ncbi:MAG: hypothetical protein CMJ81_05520 [Planctomycetaceae bacterium]|nr:hypothetical protein [Planctomycetaceae bacterium]
MQLRLRKIFLCSLSLVCLLFFSPVSVWAQRGSTFSIDFQGPTGGGIGPLNGTKDSFASIPIDEGAILTTGSPAAPPIPNPTSPGPLPAPGVLIGSVPGSGAPYGDLNLVPGIKDAVEVDALSYGRDGGRKKLFFSVDEFAVGDQVFGAGAASTPPDVFTEGGFGNKEASADVFKFNGLAVITIMGSPGVDSRAVLDGDGLAPFGAPGVGLVEPNAFTWGDPVDVGDNLDAVDMNTRKGNLLGPVFFSLDSYFPDTLETGVAGGGPNTGTARGNLDVLTGISFSGADVLMKMPVAGGAATGPTIYAAGADLGLDKAGYDTDDLDALALMDDGEKNGNGYLFFDPGNDRLLFSVRRDSAIIGTPDGTYGLAIEPGDILRPPTSSAGLPSIFITAEALGLATIRSGTTGGMNTGDDLDALDVVGPPRDLNFDDQIDVPDIDIIFDIGDLVLGVATDWQSVELDLNSDSVVDNDDLDLWLAEAAIDNGYDSAYIKGDTDLDRDVDLQDFLNLANNFDPAGTASSHSWGNGNTDGNSTIDLSDYVVLASNFSPASYGIDASVPEPSAMLLALLAVCGASICLRR